MFKQIHFNNKYLNELYEQILFDYMEVHKAIEEAGKRPQARFMGLNFLSKLNSELIKLIEVTNFKTYDQELLLYTFDKLKRFLENDETVNEKDAIVFLQFVKSDLNNELIEYALEFDKKGAG